MSAAARRTIDDSRPAPKSKTRQPVLTLVKSAPALTVVDAMSDKGLDDLSRMFNKHIRGWVNYYGRYYPSALRRAFACFGDQLHGFK